MNQPKFKFGDKVRILDSGLTFEIFAIAKSAPGKFSYRDEYYKSLFIPEGALEIYQEPQKKKLYAWASSDGVIFHVNDGSAGTEVFYRLGMNAGNFKRAPEYDIEYPETK